MNNEQVRFERRPTQRFALLLPVSVRLAGADQESSGYTQDLSARGVLFYTDLPLARADAVELTFLMPSEISLVETMRVRCRGTVVRIVSPSGGLARGVAVRIEGYEFLPEPESLAQRSDSFRSPTIASQPASLSKPGVPGQELSSNTPILP